MISKSFTQSEMVSMVARKLRDSSLPTADPSLLARHLLSYYNYDLEKVKFIKIDIIGVSIIVG